MKQFLSKNDAELQTKRVDALEAAMSKYTDMLDWQAGVKRGDIVRVADRIIKLVKKTRKMWLRGGFIDMFELGHSEPEFTAPSGEPIPERELSKNEMFPPIVRPNTRHLKMGKK